MDFSQELDHGMLPHNFTVKIPFINYDIPLSDSVITMWIIMAFLMISAYILTKKLQIIPKGRQNFVEMIVDFINSFCKNNIGHHWKHFSAYLGTVLLFLAFANIISIFNIIPRWEQLYKLTHWEFLEHLPDLSLRPPTRDINIAACFAVFSILIVLVSGIKFKKVSGWLKSFIQPSFIVFPIKIMEYFIKPMSLTLRLFGNILGAFVFMEFIYFTFPVLIPAAFSIYFDLFDGILQAYVFVFLTSLYIAEAIE